MIRLAYMTWAHKHLNVHSLKKYPHKWIGAILLSPILVGERIYHDRYHLNYVHAKKLFLLDLSLLFGTLILIFATWFWHQYDPEVVDFIELRIAVSDESGNPIDRIPSGSVIRYTIEYENTSDSVLERPRLTLTLPTYFDLDCIDCGAPFDDQTNSITLPDLPPGANGYVTITGRYFGIPNQPEELIVRLTYTQEGRTTTETRHAKIISTLRGSLLEMSLRLPAQMLATGEAPFAITLTNTSRATLDTILVPLELTNEVRLIPNAQIETDASHMIVRDLTPSSTITLTGRLQTAVPTGLNTTVSLAPELLIDGARLPQTAVPHTITIIRPSATLETAVDQSSVQPGERLTGGIILTNTGNTELRSVEIQIPIAENIIDTTKVAHLIRNGAIILTPGADTIAPQTQITLPFSLPIKTIPTGATNLQLQFEPTLRSDVTDSIEYTFTGTASPIVSIGSQLMLSGHAIYYTNEGDQLGRGPLPPNVGEETRYYTILTIRNTTSRVRNVTFTGKLPANVRFTGKTSVSAGNDITYTEATRTMNWEEFDLQPFETVGLYIELGITPLSTHLGTFPVLIEHMQVSAEDTFIEKNITTFGNTVTVQLNQDTIGQAIGDRVTN